MIVSRFLTYQSERFPLIVYGVLVGCISLSITHFAFRANATVDYLLQNLWDVRTLASGCIAFLWFLLLRIADEFKDNKYDVVYRSYLPVPRGLVTLNELGLVALVAAMMQIALLFFWLPSAWWAFALVSVYLILMRFEFFVGPWLQKHQYFYVLSHMVSLPLIFWFVIQWTGGFSIALFFYFCTLYTNGLVLEIGRKIKSPDKEEPGVISYSQFFGHRIVAILWSGLLLVTAIFALLALFVLPSTHLGGALTICVLALCCLWPAYKFWHLPTAQHAKRVENTASIWTLLLFVLLGFAA